MKLTSKEVRMLANSPFAFTALWVLLKDDPANVEKLEQLASEDVFFDRWCVRNNIPTQAEWEELKK